MMAPERKDWLRPIDPEDFDGEKESWDERNAQLEEEADSLAFDEWEAAQDGVAAENR